ncbi:MAG: HlyD family type I secretion periplasmic adaptor subunit [Hyphomonadaceae bacterium]
MALVEHIGPGKGAVERRPDDSASEARSGLTLIALFFGVFGLWAAFAPLDSGVVSAGEVKVSGNRQVVQHRDGGTVSRVAVREGDHVEAGQLLIELSDVELVAQERALASQSIELEASRERLLAEGAGRNTMQRPAAWAALPPEHAALADAVFARQQRELGASTAATGASVSVLGQRQVAVAARIEGYRQEIEAVDNQARIIADELAGLRALEAEGFAAATRVRAVERAQAELIGRRAELMGMIEQSRETISETNLQSISVRRDRSGQIAEELRMTDERLADIMPRLQATRLQLESTRVRAPATGRVVGLTVFNVGAVVRPGEKILELVPDEQGLVLEVRVRPVDADNLERGQRAQVRFSAFEGRQMPYANGVVERISADRFEDERTGQHYFVADIRVPPEELEKLSSAAGMEELPLSPGLPVEVVIPLRQRTALQYLLEPLTQSIWRSFRQN